MLLFAAAVFLLIASPGPGVLSAAGISAAFGFRVGIRFVVGLCIGNAFVFFAVASGLATLAFAHPALRIVLLGLSTLYLVYLALRIAFAGSTIAFIRANRAPGITGGFLLQPINPKAYAVSSALISGFHIYPNQYWSEIAVKFFVFNLIWIPLHIIWVWVGGTVGSLNLSRTTQRNINFAMAASLIFVVTLSIFTLVQGN